MTWLVGIGIAATLLYWRVVFGIWRSAWPMLRREFPGWWAGVHLLVASIPLFIWFTVLGLKAVPW